MELPRLMDENGQYTIRLHPISCPVYQSLSPLSTANLELPSTDNIKTFDWVQIFTPDGKSEYYRVASVSTNAVTGDKSVYLEHGACTLGDILIPDTAVDVTPSSGRSTSHGANTKEYIENKTDTISNLLSYILNKQPATGKWAVGTVEATDTIYIELGGFSLLSSISSMMQYIPDYQLEFVQNSTSQWLVNIKHRPTAVLCEGRLSRNLVSCDVTYSTANIITRVYSDGITGGHVDSPNISVYGLHEETQTLSDNLDASQKLSIIQSYLSNHDHPTVSIIISGLELSQITGLTIDRFAVGSVCRIVIPWLNITEEEVIIDKRYSDVYNAPEDVTLTLANATPDLVIAMAAITSTVSGGGGGMGGGLKGQQEQKEKEKKRYETRMEKTDEYFRFLATDTQWNEMGAGTLTAYGQLVVTSTSVQSVVNDIAGSGFSSITQMAGSVTSLVSKTGVDSLGEGETLYSEISQNADKISLVVTSTKNPDTGVVTNSVNTASIILAINGNKQGDSSVTIQADKIYLDAAKSANLSDVLFIASGGGFWVQRVAQFGSSGGSIVTINNGTVNAPTLQVNSGGDLKFSPSSQTGTAISINHATAASIVDSISKNTNLPSGQFGFHYTTIGNSTGADINFNIAATQYFIDEMAAAELRGWNAACDMVTRVSNTIYGPQKNSYGNYEQKYRANYSSSFYSASSHSHSDAWMKIDGVPGTYRSDATVNLTSFSGNIQFNSGYDSYSPSSYSASSFSWTTY